MPDTFERWLQQRLNVHGAGLVVDGDIGRATIAALRDFQSNHDLRITGLADPPTIEALRRDAVEGEEPPEPTLPPWMFELVRKMGLHEQRDNEELTAFLKTGKFLGDPKKLPWCGDAVESAFAKTLPNEKLPTNPFFAQNWKDFGTESDPITGAVGVIRWSANAGHVGFVSKATKTTISMVGGNQSNAITNSIFPRRVFIAFRWPRTFPIVDYPEFNGATLDAGGVIGTR